MRLRSSVGSVWLAWATLALLATTTSAIDIKLKKHKIANLEERHHAPWPQLDRRHPPPPPRAQPTRPPRVQYGPRRLGQRNIPNPNVNTNVVPGGSHIESVWVASPSPSPSPAPLPSNGTGNGSPVPGSVLTSGYITPSSGGGNAPNTLPAPIPSPSAPSPSQNAPIPSPSALSPSAPLPSPSPSPSVNGLPSPSANGVLSPSQNLLPGPSPAPVPSPSSNNLPSPSPSMVLGPSPSGNVVPSPSPSANTVLGPNPSPSANTIISSPSNVATTIFPSPSAAALSNGAPSPSPSPSVVVPDNLMSPSGPVPSPSSPLQSPSGSGLVPIPDNSMSPGAPSPSPGAPSPSPGSPSPSPSGTVASPSSVSKVRAYAPVQTVLPANMKKGHIYTIDVRIGPENTTVPWLVRLDPSSRRFLFADMWQIDTGAFTTWTAAKECQQCVSGHMITALSAAGNGTCVKDEATYGEVTPSKQRPPWLTEQAPVDTRAAECRQTCRWGLIRFQGSRSRP